MKVWALTAISTNIWTFFILTFFMNFARYFWFTDSHFKITYIWPCIFHEKLSLLSQFTWYFKMRAHSQKQDDVQNKRNVCVCTTQSKQKHWTMSVISCLNSWENNQMLTINTYLSATFWQPFTILSMRQPLVHIYFQSVY